MAPSRPRTGAPAPEVSVVPWHHANSTVRSPSSLSWPWWRPPPAQELPPPRDPRQLEVIDGSPSAAAPADERRARIAEALRTGDYERAEALLLEAAEAQPRSAEVLRQLGGVFLARGRPAERRGGPEEGRGDRAARRAQPFHAGHVLRRPGPPGLGAPRAGEARRGGSRQPPLPLLGRAARLRRRAVRDGGRGLPARARARPALHEGTRQPGPLLRGPRPVRRGRAQLGGGDPAERARRRRSRPGRPSTSA